jgi:hypothetical protein
VLLHAEQGLGDTIQFCRYATLVAARGGVPILASAASGGAADALIARGALRIRRRRRCWARRPPEFDLECPLLSLPCRLRDHNRDSSLAGRLPGRRSGICGRNVWAELSQRENSNVQSKKPRAPSIRLLLGEWVGFEPFMGRIRSNQAIAHRPSLGRQSPLQGGRTALHASQNSAAAVAHCAASPGFRCKKARPRISWPICPPIFLSGTERAAIKTWLKQPRSQPRWTWLSPPIPASPTWPEPWASRSGFYCPTFSDWRWMQEIETTPWYPTARLFRQRTPGDWAGVFDRVMWELEQPDRSALKSSAQRDFQGLHCLPRP